MNNKVILMSLLAVVVAFTFLLLCPVMETYMQWDMPFVTINLEHFNVFGYTVTGGDKQMGIVTLCGLLAMLPARLIQVLLTELSK